MKKHTLSEKGRIAYLCVAFLALAFSLTAWRMTHSATKALTDTKSTTAPITVIQPTEEYSVEPADTPVTNVPDTRTTEETEKESETVFSVLDYFVSPVNGKILSHYSNGALVKNETTGDWRTHNGTDFSANAGDVVKAINNGIVTAVYDDALWGTVVEIDHGNDVTAKYCGLSPTVAVQKGEIVRSEDKIGVLASVPVESGEKPHLHLEIRIDGALINPLDLLQ